jgi:hypothetical protein
VRDLLIITPTRGRPEGAQRLIDAVAATATARTDLILAVDNDDASYGGLTGRFSSTRGPRATCGAWTNKVAAELSSGYRAVASIVDDHEPLTPGWDSMLLDAIDEMGGTGIAYGDDTNHYNVPTAVVISTDIVAALGWVFQPTMSHYYADLVWKDIAEDSCLAYLPHVVIKHYNPTFSSAPMDDTYAQARTRYGEDGEAYDKWCEGSRRADTDKVRALHRARTAA